MLMYALIGILVIAVFAPIVYYILCGMNGVKTKRVLKLNLGVYFTVLIAATMLLFTGTAFADSGSAANPHSGLGYIAAALVTGLACVGAGIAVSSASSAALGAVSEDPKVLGKALIFVALAEGVAIYGLIISIMILNDLKI